MNKTYDLAIHRLVDTDAPGGTFGFISWERLVEQLRLASEFKSDEIVTHLQLTQRGIHFRIERKK